MRNLAAINNQQPTTSYQQPATNNQSQMLETSLILIPALPLTSAILTAALGPKVLGSRSHWPTILALLASFCLSAVLLLDVNYASQQMAADTQSPAVGWQQTVTLWTWADVPRADGSNNFLVDVTLQADALTAIMLAMVTFVALLVAIYSVGYMRGDRGYWRFFSYFSLFVFSMTMLVSVSNFLLLYVFWEAVGLCSYLLIGFWYERPAAAAAGKKAFLVNRVGDFGFAMGVFLIWTVYGTLNFHDTDAAGRPLAVDAPSIVNAQVVDQSADSADSAAGVPGVLGQTRLRSGDFFGAGDSTSHDSHLALAICLLLLIGACGKSAQFPLHVWLPDAMEGPTPVSALIHAATMVTAGVYMVTRCTPLYTASPNAQLAVATIGCFTALMAGIIALTQTDLKRILAYSTVSQLGYMFLSLGTGSLVGIIAGMFHLFTHAFFKALLFLGAGSVMHAMGGVIDIRRFGGLRRLMPVTHITFLFGCLALCGVWPFAGFFSKDAIIAAVYDRREQNVWHLYTFRAFFRTFYGRLLVPSEAGHHAEESPGSMTVPLGILAVCALFAGLVVGGFNDLLSRTPSLAYNALQAPAAAAAVSGEPHVEVHQLTQDSHAFIATASTIIVLSCIALTAFLYLGNLREVNWLARAFAPIYRLSQDKFFFDEIYAVLVVWPGLALAWLCYWFDRWIVDGLVDLVGRVPPAVGAVLRSTQTGLVHLYAMLMILGLIALASVLLM